MRDLMKLASHHLIEQKLYNSDALDRIYRLLGESRVTRWLGSTNIEELDDEALWEKLISFLEKDMKVNQQKSLVWKKYPSYKNEAKDRGEKYNNHHTKSDDNSTDRCFTNEVT